MKKSLLIYFLILMSGYAYSNNGDTLRIVLSINDTSILKPAEKISIKLKTSSGFYKGDFQDNIFICNAIIKDTSTIIVKYNNYDIETCWSIEPKSLAKFNQLSIELITDKKILKRKMKQYRYEKGRRSMLKNLFKFSLHYKEGGDTGCITTSWQGQ